MNVYSNTSQKILVIPIFLSAFMLAGCSDNMGSGSSQLNSVNNQPTQTTISSLKVSPAMGQILGGCMYQYDQNFAVSTAPKSSDVMWPMLTCDSAGNTSCASGFSAVDETPVQMNCATNPSTSLTLCYWKTRKCVRTGGSKDLSVFVKGQSYGGCLMKFDSNFSQTGAPLHVAWPMLSCNNNSPVCDTGFKPLVDAPVQMNCSSTPSNSNFLGCYWSAVKCVKQ